MSEPTLLICDHDLTGDTTDLVDTLTAEAAKAGMTPTVFRQSLLLSNKSAKNVLVKHIDECNPLVIVAHVGKFGEIYHEESQWAGSIVYVSSSGRFEPHRQIGNRYDLFMRHPKGRDELSWGDVLSVAKDAPCCTHVVKAPEEYVHVFGAPLVQPKVVLPALAILCQGYLAALAQPGGEAVNRDLPEPVKSALQDMGWWDIADSSMLKAALRGEDEAELRRLREQVVLGDYWASLGTLRNLADMCAQEWHPAGKVEDLEALKESDKFTLINKLDLGAFPIDDPKMVANAYLALHEKLGGT